MSEPKSLMAAGMTLNLMMLKALVEDVRPGELVILSGGPAQHASYLALYELMQSDLLKMECSFAFRVDPKIPSDQLIAFVFDGDSVDAIGIVRSLSIPTGFRLPKQVADLLGEPYSGM